jgi:hypothetical protein
VELNLLDLSTYRMIGDSPDVTLGHEQLTADKLERVVQRDRMVEIEEVQQDTRSFRTLFPVVEFGWEGHNVDNAPLHGICLAKHLAQGVKLVNLPQTHDLQTGDGVRATYGTALRPHDFKNSQRFFYVRESILRTFLRKNDLSLVWAVWGEREPSGDSIERFKREGKIDNLPRGDFQAVYRF